MLCLLPSTHSSLSTGEVYNDEQYSLNPIRSNGLCRQIGGITLVSLKEVMDVPVTGTSAESARTLQCYTCSPSIIYRKGSRVACPLNPKHLVSYMFGHRGCSSPHCDPFYFISQVFTLMGSWNFDCVIRGAVLLYSNPLRGFLIFQR